MVGEKGLVLVGFDESRGLAREAVGEMLARWAIGQPWVAVRRKIPAAAIGAAALVAAHVDVEALVFRPEPFGSEVPFAGKKGRVPRGFHGLCKRRRVQRQAVIVRGGQQDGVAPPL